MAERKPTKSKDKKKAKRIQVNDPKVYRAWYEANKEKLAARRRERYESDPEYRKKVLEQNRKRREKKREEIAKRPKPKVRMPRDRKPMTLMVIIDGAPLPKKLVHIGGFVRAIGKSISTIHQWERLGLLPKTPLFKNGNEKRERLFTAEMISVVKTEMMKRGGRIRSNDPTFYDDIVCGWAKVGVDMNTSKVLGDVE